MSNILNPLLSKVKLPGKVFQLPSKGTFYKPGETLDVNVKDGEIQVKPMSALTEMKMRSADLLISGKILREVCAECIPEIIKPENLCTKDVDALFLFLLMSTYGSNKHIKSMHDCPGGKFHDYTVNLDTVVMKPNNEILEHRQTLYTVTLPNGQTVELKPVTFENSIYMVVLRQELMRRENEKQDIPHFEIEKLIIEDLMAVIISVTDIIGGETVKVTDRALISEWVRCISTTQQKIIIEAAQKSAEWGFDFRVPLVCKDCGKEYGYDLDLNPINFFSG